MRARKWLAAAAILAGLPFVPLPRACDPRQEEVGDARYVELTAFANTRTRREIESDLRVVDPDGLLARHYTLGEATMEIRLGVRDPPVVSVPLRASPAPPRTPRRQRIALDPGHFGGAWSRLEKRHLGRDGGPVIREGDLAWATARILERALRAEGAEVRLLRGPPPTEDFPAGVDPSFDPGREAASRLAEQHLEDPPWRAPLWIIPLWWERRRLAREGGFELYLRHELRRRAIAADAFAADVTLSLHYDVTGTDSNGVLVFVPGAFVENDLATAAQRFWAFRRVLDGTLDETRRLAGALGASMMRGLALPALTVGHDHETGRLWRALDADRAVYARNLAILRRTSGVVLLLEGPCVNQSEEYRRLQGTELEVDGKRYPARVGEYAAAVRDGLRAP